MIVPTLDSPYANHLTRQFALTAITKISSRSTTSVIQQEHVAEVLAKYTTSPELELQQRAVEFVSLFSLGDLRSGVLERMPPPELKATVTGVGESYSPCPDHLSDVDGAVSENKPVGSTHGKDVRYPYSRNMDDQFTQRSRCRISWETTRLPARVHPSPTSPQRPTRIYFSKSSVNHPPRHKDPHPPAQRQPKRAPSTTSSVSSVQHPSSQPPHHQELFQRLTRPHLPLHRAQHSPFHSVPNPHHGLPLHPPQPHVFLPTQRTTRTSSRSR